MIEVSKDWTTEERQKLVASMSLRISNEARNAHIDRNLILDFSERIYMLSTKSSEFLEMNRLGVLRGL